MYWEKETLAILDTGDHHSCTSLVSGLDVQPQQDKSGQVQVHSAASPDEKDIARAQSSCLGCVSGQDGLPPRDHRCASILSLLWALGASSRGRGSTCGISSPAQ